MCPVCAVPLTMSERQNVEIDYCPQCRGVWLDRGELEKLMSLEREETQAVYGQPRPYTRPDHHHDHHKRYDDDDDDRRRYGGRDGHHKKKRFDLFDIFD